MPFEIIGEITAVETIAAGHAIHELARLRKIYGPGRWRRRKGVATLRLSNGTVRKAGVHWYEATGVGRKESKIKQFLDSA